MDPQLELDLDPNFEPQQRARSNTWPLPRPENYVEIKEENDVETLCNGRMNSAMSAGGAAMSLMANGILGGGGNGGGGGGGGGNNLMNSSTVDLNGDGSKLPDGSCSGGPKKNSSRRNAWGNMSYADLITQAIQSSPDKRLTLSQIYDWMVQNVPYFKDKGDSNSSAGWKNSIRHNLSLHNRFMRVQNEGTGKSSWWMINPDAKPGKSARRRATSMETSKYEKKRGRVKKKVEALRAGLTTTPSPSSSVSEGLDMFPESPQIHPHSFQLSPGDFRPRASSNASSIGRLSPIPAVESELQEGQWSPSYSSGIYHPGLPSQPAHLERFNPDQLVDNITENMKIRENGFLAPTSDLPHMNLPSNGYTICHSAMTTQHGYAPNYPGQNQDYRSLAAPHSSLQGSGMPRSPQRLLTAPSDLTSAPPPYSIASLQGLSPSQSLHSLSPSHTLEQHGYGGGDSGSLSNSHSQGSLLGNGYGPVLGRFCNNGGPSNSDGSGLLRAALAHGVNNSSPSPEGTPTASQMMSQLMGALNNNGPMPNDLDLNLDSLQGGFDCNVDEVIKHELSMDGSLDFNFSQQQQQQQQQQQHPGTQGDFNLGFGTSTTVPNLLNDRPPPSSQPPPLCSLAALAPGRSWVR